MDSHRCGDDNSDDFLQKEILCDPTVVEGETRMMNTDAYFCKAWNQKLRGSNINTKERVILCTF